MPQETRSCKNCSKNFGIEPEDFVFYQKMDVPPPTWCPLCREMRRWSFRNERNLYPRQCDKCKKQVISTISPDKSLTVYCRDCFNSDEFEPTAYGREFDFTRPVFDQIRELMHQVPIIALLGGMNCINSDYVNMETDDKNCYMNVGGHFNEDCYYNTFSLYGKNNVDNYWVYHSELLYESSDCHTCYRCFFCRNIVSCNECWLCFDCRGCSNCFGCTNQRNKQYMIFNEQLSKEEYASRIAELTKDYAALEYAKKQFEQTRLTRPHRHAFAEKCERSTGSNITQCKNVTAGFDCDESEDAKYVQIGLQMKDSFDGSAVGIGELVYEAVGCGWISRSLCCVSCFIGMNFAYYSLFCRNSDYLFGCVSMKKNQYCILNKQYSKEEYEALVPKIMEHMKTTEEWGEFFPPQLSLFGYNESVAQAYFPLTKKEALAKGFPWQDAIGFTTGKETISAGDVPEIDEVRTDIIKEILCCIVCKRNYKIIAQELQFYQSAHLPLPRQCPQCRHENRMRLRGTSHVLHHRTCVCAGTTSANGVITNIATHVHGDNPCPNNFETAYTPDSPEIIYCEACYQAEVI
ncbi:MAG: hypothetical protein Q8P56_05720 [Candidatus Uhrbacteria bacterium]|nr:hypothetical protein [Candidatus Uhrbacteria bacterium]